MSMAPKSNRSSESPETVAGTRVSSEQQPLLVQAPSSSTASSFNLPQEHPQKPSTRAGEPPPYIDIEWNGDRVQCVKTTDDDTLGDGENLGSVAFEVGKDLVVLTGLASKFPATVTYLVAKTLHEIPRLYGDSTARDFGNITDTLSGMAAAGQCLFLGIYDGVTGIFLQPLTGAQKGGVLGFLKGFCFGIGGAAFKPAEAGCGVAGYTLIGMLRDFQKLGRIGKPKGLQQDRADE